MSQKIYFYCNYNILQHIHFPHRANPDWMALKKRKRKKRQCWISYVKPKQKMNEDFTLQTVYTLIFLSFPNLMYSTLYLT